MQKHVKLTQAPLPRGSGRASQVGGRLNGRLSGRLSGRLAGCLCGYRNGFAVDPFATIRIANRRSLAI